MCLTTKNWARKLNKIAYYVAFIHRNTVTLKTNLPCKRNNKQGRLFKTAVSNFKEKLSTYTV